MSAKQIAVSKRGPCRYMCSLFSNTEIVPAKFYLLHLIRVSRYAMCCAILVYNFHDVIADHLESLVGTHKMDYRGS